MYTECSINTIIIITYTGSKLSQLQYMHNYL